jgi:hypothetical protein
MDRSNPFPLLVFFFFSGHFFEWAKEMRRAAKTDEETLNRWRGKTVALRNKYKCVSNSSAFFSSCTRNSI